MRFEQRARGELGADAEEALLLYAGGGEVNVLENVVERDVRVVSGGACERGGGQSGEGGDGPFWSGEAGEDEVVPDHVRVNFANGLEQAHGIFDASEFPAADYVEAVELRLLVDVERLAVGIGCEVTVGELVGENRQLDFRVAAQLASDVEGIFVQLPSAGGKSANQTNLHGNKPPQNIVMPK